MFNHIHRRFVISINHIAIIYYIRNIHLYLQVIMQIPVASYLHMYIYIYICYKLLYFTPIVQFCFHNSTGVLRSTGRLYELCKILAYSMSMVQYLRITEKLYFYVRKCNFNFAIKISGQGYLIVDNITLKLMKFSSLSLSLFLRFSFSLSSLKLIFERDFISSINFI